MNKKTGIVLGVVVCVLLVALIFLIMKLNLGGSPGGVGALVIDPNSEDWALVDTSDDGAGAQTGIAIPGYKEIGMLANETAQEVSLGNPSQNTCNFVISIVLGDGTELYRSGLIAPGKGVYDIELKKALSEGTYEAVLNYECYTNDEKPLNGASTDLILIMQ